MNNYNPCVASFDDYNSPVIQNNYKSPIGKILSISATAWTLISAYDLPHINDDAASLDEIVDGIVQCENKIEDDISCFQRVLTSFTIDNNYIARQNLLDQLLSFKSLIHNWDGYGAIPVSARCASAAIRVINGLSDQVIEEIEDVFPNTNGSVSFKWSNRLGERFSLSVGASVLSYYCLKNGVSVEMHDDLIITDDTISSINSGVQSLL